MWLPHIPEATARFLTALQKLLSENAPPEGRAQILPVHKVFGEDAPPEGRAQVLPVHKVFGDDAPP